MSANSLCRLDYMHILEQEWEKNNDLQQPGSDAYSLRKNFDLYQVVSLFPCKYARNATNYYADRTVVQNVDKAFTNWSSNVSVAHL